MKTLLNKQTKTDLWVNNVWMYIMQQIVWIHKPLFIFLFKKKKDICTILNRRSYW